ncbi:hypothetical protein [Streptomyces sp. NBC_00083]|uniref:hypothetical protein n=1 Tax=Streptomyces sp. NBC_00083 TaxID=2975647 RepID=UPI00224E4B7E|nr:hypothetical protein [Streptomyces sp. NBC_00083]MCX5387260.1 hypothetical protein [Streptomyces sp. NBC_00083]
MRAGALASPSAPVPCPAGKPEAESAITVYERGGEHAEAPRAEAVRFAALIEGDGLGRLGAAAVRARGADLPEAAGILDSLRQSFENRRG